MKKEILIKEIGTGEITINSKNDNSIGLDSGALDPSKTYYFSGIISPFIDNHYCIFELDETKK